MRTCVATNSKLHLIEPLGFNLDEKSVKRSAVNYLDKLDAAGYIKVDRTAGLDVIYPMKELDSDAILKEYYENK